ALGALGNGTATGSYATPQPVALVSGGNVSGISQVASGEQFTCARAADGSAKCWGANSAGQLGDSTTNSSNKAVSVVDLSNSKQIGVGIDHACALIDDDNEAERGQIKCWGSDSTGKLGAGFSPHTDSSTPVSVKKSDASVL